jgi:hypothetical protein
VDRLLGREHEMGGLVDQLHHLASGTSGWASVSGEPGIGKSRLLETPKSDYQFVWRLAVWEWEWG